MANTRSSNTSKHPAQVVTEQKRKRRSAAEVKAEKEALAALKAEQKAEKELKAQQLKQINEEQRERRNALTIKLKPSQILQKVPRSLPLSNERAGASGEGDKAQGEVTVITDDSEEPMDAKDIACTPVAGVQPTDNEVATNSSARKIRPMPTRRIHPKSSDAEMADIADEIGVDAEIVKKLLKVLSSKEVTSVPKYQGTSLTFADDDLDVMEVDDAADLQVRASINSTVAPSQRLVSII